MRRLGSFRSARFAAVRGVILAMATATLVVSSSAGAAVAAGEVEILVNGTSTAQSSDPVFEVVGKMVPLDSQSATFVVRNTGDSPGYLRVSVADVVSGDPVLSQALSLQASVQGFAGEPVPLSAAAPCHVLTEGYVLRPKSSVTVYTTLALGDLNGQDGQNATASFNFYVGLSELGPGSSAPTRCTPNSSVLPGTPDAPERPDVPPAGPGSNPVDQPDSTPGEDPDPTPSATPTAEPVAPAFVWPAFPTFDLDTNTVRLFQDWGALVPGLAFVLGAGWFLFVARRRRKKDEDENEDDDSDFEESYAV